MNGDKLNLQLIADANGQAVIVVRATDTSSNPATNSVLGTINLSVSAVNDAPRLLRALPDPVNTSEDVNPPSIALSPLYFFDPDAGLDGVITYTITNSNTLLVTPTITNGVLSLNLGANRSGSATITIQASDRSGQSVSDTFTLNVSSVDDAPTTVSDSYSVPRGTTFTANDARGTNANPGDNGVLANDSDPEGSAITAEVVNQPSNGTLTFNADGTFTYVHNGSQLATDSFTYRAIDAAGNRSAVTTVNITITAAPAPTHQNPQAVGGENAATGRRDVNADGFITPIDALLIINFLNANRGGRSVVGLPAPPPYRDVDGNNFISPLDALLVINYLNSRRGGSGEGEGQSESDQNLALLMTPIDVGRGTEQTGIGVRMLPLGDSQFYGPVQPLSEAEDFFAEVGGEGWVPADTSWIGEGESSEEDQVEPIDLIFASLMPEIDEKDLS